MIEDKMRKEFEAWARSTKRTEHQLRRLSNGDYEVTATHWELMAWKAANRAAVPDEIRRLADVMLRESQGVPVLTDWHESARTVCEWVASAPEVKP